MTGYMRDGRIPIAWRIDIPNRCVELGSGKIEAPVANLHGADVFEFASPSFTVDEVFRTVLN